MYDESWCSLANRRFNGARQIARDGMPSAVGSSAIAPGSTMQIRAVNAYLAGRSENAYQLGRYPTFFHNNLSTQVSIRSLAFTNNFNTSITSPQ